MHIRVFGTAICTYFCIATLLVQATAYAHTSQHNSAQIILRDGQVEVRLLIDTRHWADKLQDPQSWLLGDTETLLTEEDMATEALVIKLFDVLLDNTAIQLNDEDLQLEKAPKAHELEHKQAHGLPSEYRLSAKHSNADLKTLSIQFPASLGKVNVSIAKPVYGVAEQGEFTRFQLP